MSTRTETAMFQEDQLVVANYPDIGVAGEVGIVACRNVFGSYEVMLLHDHVPGSGWDPVISFGSTQLRPATSEEVESARMAWEEKHGRTLGFQAKFTPAGLFAA